MCVLQLNQLPGAAAYASKSDLAQASGPLPFLPKSFALPEQAEAYKEYANSNPDIEWLIKGGMHRGVRHVSSKEQALDVATSESTEAFVQQLIRPYLIDGCALPPQCMQPPALWRRDKHQHIHSLFQPQAEAERLPPTYD